MILIKPLNKKWNPGSTFIKDKKILRAYQLWLAELYLEYIKKVIRTQSYYNKYKWKKLTKSYLAYKKRKGYDTRIWIATGTLLEALKVYTYRDLIVIGTRDKDRYSGALSMDTVVKYMEFGTYGNRGRPVFGPAYRYFSSSPRRFYNKFVKKLQLERKKRRGY